MRTRSLIPLIVAAINSGSQMYNSGDVNGCAALYQATGTQLLQAGLEEPLRGSLEEALSRSQVADSNEKAWLLRHAFDKILEVAASDAPSRPLVPSAAAVYMELLSFESAADASTWYALHDGVMGGVSSGGVQVRDGEAIFSGQVRTEYNGGFASVRRSVAWDVSGFDGFCIDVRGDGRRSFSFNIKDALCVSMGGVNLKQSFSPAADTSRIFLPFAEFRADFRGRAVARPPMQTAEVRELSLMATKPAGEFSLVVSKVGVYKDTPAP